MKRNLLSFRVLSLVLMFMFSASIWADDVTVTFTFKTDGDITYTAKGTSGGGAPCQVAKEGITLAATDGYTDAGKSLIVYKQSSLTITAPGNIKKVDVSYNGKVYPFDEAVGDGAKNTKYAASGAHPASYTPETPAATVVLNNANTGKTDLLTLAVTYAEKELKVAKPTFSVEATKFTAASIAVGLACETEGAVLKYILNDGADILDYTEPIAIKGVATAPVTTITALAIANGDTAKVSKTYTYLPTVVSITNIKKLADDTEFVFVPSADHKITYVNGKNAYVEYGNYALNAYDLGLALEAGKYISKGDSIFATKKTYNTYCELVKNSETANSKLTIKEGAAIAPTTRTIALMKTANDLCRYVSIANVKLDSIAGNLYAIVGSDTIQVYNSFKTELGTLATPCAADLTGIVSYYKDYQLQPTAIANIKDHIADGVSGTCTWSIDINGVMTIKPTEGTEGTLGTWTNATGTDLPWKASASTVTSVKFENTVKAPTLLCFFTTMSNLESVDFAGLDASQATSAKRMFNGCSKMKNIDISMLNTENVTDMANFIYSCTAVESVKVGNTAKVTDMKSFFYGNKNLKKVDFSLASTESLGVSSKGVENINLKEVAPDTLILSKNFGKCANGTNYVTLPTKKYMDENAKTKSFDLPAQQADFYAYNEALADYGKYVPYEEQPDTPTAITTVSAASAQTTAAYNLAGQRVNANAKGIIIQNGRKYIVK